MNRTILLFASVLLFACNYQVNTNEKLVPDANNLLADLTITINDLDIRSENNVNLAYYEGKLFSGVAYSYFENGEKQIKQGYLDGKKEGTWAIWYPGGGMQKEGFIKDGLSHGKYREWYENGNLRYEYEYDQNKKTGVWKGWYDDGTPYTIRHFTDDQLHGSVLVYDSVGTLTKEMEYDQGELLMKINHLEGN